MLKGWLKVPAAAEYFGLSERTMRTWVSEGFPHSKLPSGTILIELAAGDEYLRNFGNVKKDQELIDDILKGLS